VKSFGLELSKRALGSTPKGANLLMIIDEMVAKATAAPALPAPAPTGCPE
jgi:hypothetical protein